MLLPDINVMKYVSNNTQRLIILDSFRGLAAIIVLFHHIFKINIDFFKSNLNKISYAILDFISSLNHESVIFFFILSGFSIGLSLKNKQLNNKTVINEYIYRRFKRILPIYWFSLLVTLIAGILMGKLYMKDYGILNFVGNLLFLQTSAAGTPAWITPYGLNGPLWSLAFEFFFYMIFPISYLINELALTKVSVNIKFMILLILSAFAIALNKLFFVPYFLFFASLPIWILGFLSSQTYLFHKRYDTLFALVCIISILYLGVGKIYVHSDSLALISKGLLMNSVFYLITVKSTYISSNNNIVKIFNVLFYEIGKGSYAIYALHYPLLLFLKYYDIKLLFQIPIIIVYVCLSMILEKWTIKWKWEFLKQNYCGYVKGKYLLTE